jgi:hypothetical protein
MSNSKSLTYTRVDLAGEALAVCGWREVAGGFVGSGLGKARAKDAIRGITVKERESFMRLPQGSKCSRARAKQ